MSRYRADTYPGVAFFVLGPAIEGYDEDGEPVESDTHVRAVMVGDDREHTLDRDELTPLSDDESCRECGQIGCQADGR